MPLNGKQKRKLRALGHHLTAVVQVGSNGVTPGVIAAARQALADHELIKVKIADDRDGRVEAVALLARGTGAEVAQTLGRTVLLFKPKAKKSKFAGMLSPVASSAPVAAPVDPLTGSAEAVDADDEITLVAPVDGEVAEASDDFDELDEDDGDELDSDAMDESAEDDDAEADEEPAEALYESPIEKPRAVKKASSAKAPVKKAASKKGATKSAVSKKPAPAKSSKKPAARSRKS